MSFHNCLIIRNYSKSFLNTFSINFNSTQFLPVQKKKKFENYYTREEIITECKNIKIYIKENYSRFAYKLHTKNIRATKNSKFRKFVSPKRSSLP